MRVVLDHVAVGVQRLERVLPLVVGKLGGRPGRGGPSPGFDWHTWVFRGGGQLEIITPTGPPDGFLHRFLAARGPGVHHVTFYVPDLREACDRAEAQGYPVVGYDDSRPGWQEAFLHPKGSLGIVVQLARTSPEHEAEGYGWEAPGAGVPAPEPVRFVGLRMRAPDEASARRLFEATLFGAARARDGEIEFRWPDSPLRVVVDIKPGLAPGPVALEMRSERDSGDLDDLDGEELRAFGARIERARRS
jgi:methylmalonyl-CoA/ethylmalonyl-CoA epimerase